ncbi:MAG: flagellar biosynthetic protein FliR [bacterium]
MDSFIALLNQIPDFSKYCDAGMLIFARVLAFLLNAPVFDRKDIPMLLKLGFALLFTFCFIGIAGNVATPNNASYSVCIILNIVFGALVGFVAKTIFQTIEAAGEIVNMQMGLQSAMMFDPNAKAQISVVGKLFMNLGTVIYIEIGGLYWLFSAFKRGFEIFPLYATSIPLDKFVNIDYIIMLTGNLLFIGLQIASPILLVTLAQDIILGIISKTAPQINVFQLSFAFKPVVGAAILVIILPLLINSITDFLVYYQKIF